MQPELKTKLELAGVWPRLMSIVYESLIVTAILFFSTGIALLFTRQAIAPGTVWFELYLLLMLGAYFCYCWRRSGQTVGMLAWRLMVTDLQGKRLSVAHGAARFLIATLLGFGVLGVLWMLIDTDGVALQDRLSKSRVLRLPKEPKKP